MIYKMAGMGPVCVWGGVGWVPLGGPAGSLTAGIGGCLQGAVGMVCVGLGGQLGRYSGQCDVPWARWGCVVHGLGHNVV
jgi:hypothetical protein